MKKYALLVGIVFLVCTLLACKNPVVDNGKKDPADENPATPTEVKTILTIKNESLYDLSNIQWVGKTIPKIGKSDLFQIEVDDNKLGYVLFEFIGDGINLKLRIKETVSIDKGEKKDLVITNNTLVLDTDSLFENTFQNMIDTNKAVFYDDAEGTGKSWTSMIYVSYQNDLNAKNGLKVIGSNYDTKDAELSLSLVLEKPAVVSFWYKTDTGDYGKSTLKINNEVKFSVGKTSDWVFAQYTVPAGDFNFVLSKYSELSNAYHTCSFSIDNFVIKYSNVQIIASPIFSLDEGNYDTPQSLALTTATTGATIRYTTDGSNPSITAGAVYTTPISISKNTTVKAVAYKGSIATQVVTKVYGIKVPAPVLSIPSGRYTDWQEVIVSTGSPGTIFKFTLDGTDPKTSASAQVLNTTITNKYQVYNHSNSIYMLSGTKTIKIYALQSGYTDSDVVTQSYTINNENAKFFDDFEQPNSKWNISGSDSSTKWQRIGSDVSIDGNSFVFIAVSTEDTTASVNVTGASKIRFFYKSSEDCDLSFNGKPTVNIPSIDGVNLAYPWRYFEYSIPTDTTIISFDFLAGWDEYIVIDCVRID